MRKAVTLFALTALFLLPFTACNNEKEKADNSSQGITENIKAPDFSLKDVGGNPFTLSDHSGKVKIIDFWATWCPPCRMEIPDFQSLHDKYPGDKFLMIGISLDDNSEIVKKFLGEYKVTYPVVMGNEEIANAYGGIRGIPTTFVVDKEGNIYKKYIGYTEGKVFERDILALLDK